MKSITERVFHYVERYALRKALAEWPTVRQVARGLGVGMGTVVNAIKAKPITTIKLFRKAGESIGDARVKVESPKVEKLRKVL